MRRAFFSVMPLALLVFPWLAGVSIWRAPGKSSADASGTARASVERGETETGGRVRARVSEAKRLLAAAQPTAPDVVRLAAAEPDGGRVHTFALPKETFLSKGAEASVTTAEGASVSVRVVRANGVNTAIQVADEGGRALLPLVVQYPIEREGEVTETAYYTSAHPALTSESLARDGEGYIGRMLGRAASRLEEKGVKVEPGIVEVAERLCVVEHTDHKRFMRESRPALFDEIATLYALNTGDTYRYSVSTAGAGGMIQMIAPTYETTRERHPEAGLTPDFVTGMRDHDNALAAMLLYMQDTWNDLLRQEEVRLALETGVATKVELLAAGYNSNPARLAKYLERGGHSWRTLIPRETQMYLQIYAAVEAHAD